MSSSGKNLYYHIVRDTNASIDILKNLGYDLGDLTNTVDALISIHSQKDLDALIPKLIGKNSPMHGIFQDLRKADADKKRILGPALNKLQGLLKQAIALKKEHIQTLEIEQSLQEERLDLTYPASNTSIGFRHPISITMERISEILSGINFVRVMTPTRDDEVHNFEALNIPKDHPARQMQDTFYLKSGQVLRSHNTNADAYVLQGNSTPPIYSYAMGRVYRKDHDMTHSPMFHQLDVLYANKGVSFANLVWFIKYFLNKFFEKEVNIRLRASYFPFTIISAEVDMLMNGKWLEILGCGMLHPNVFKWAGWDSSEYSAFALGLGIDRLAMLKYHIQDLRPLFEGDLRFLHTYGLYPFDLKDHAFNI